jgi:hypothetical protein
MTGTLMGELVNGLIVCGLATIAAGFGATCLSCWFMSHSRERGRKRSRAPVAIPRFATERFARRLRNPPSR